MYAKLISQGAKGIVPMAPWCGYGHLPLGDLPCFDGYVPWAGECRFGKD
jgi:hypothetical protein